MNYMLEGCAIHVYFIPSCRQWDVLASDTEKRKCSRYADALCFLKAKLSGGMGKLGVLHCF